MHNTFPRLANVTHPMTRTGLTPFRQKILDKITVYRTACQRKEGYLSFT